MATVLRYLNFSGFEIVTKGGYRIVIDPFLSGSEPHGIGPSPVSLEQLEETDLVLVSHGAFDHLGQAIEIVKRSGAILACGPDVRIHALAQGIREEQIAYLLSGCTLKLGHVSVKALDVRHISLFQSGEQWLSGQPLSFMIQVDGGPTIYHSGDTSLFSDLKLFGELYNPDVALLCVGGVRSHGFEVVPLPPEEASLALSWLGARLAIPMHYRPDSDAAERFAQLVTRERRAAVKVMDPGEWVQLEQLLAPGDSKS
jgi:L-ascorbate metabolism protein UlaG (beta-lactamase superfamily)